MQTYQVDTIISKEGILEIKGLPLHTGDRVAVTVTKQKSAGPKGNLYPLRGKPISYKAPYESVAEKDWELIE
ncbi:hypothetical protein ACFLRB_02450 [Acidobacteriota bacterium]